MLDEVALIIGAPTLAVLAARAWTGEPLRFLRVLFPSWRFFDSAAPTPRLLVRTSASEEPLGAWRDALPPIARGWASLLVNAEGNLRLAYHGLLERLVSDVAELSQGDAERASELLSYELVTNLARTSLPERPAATRFQFKVQHVGGTTDEPEDVLTSAVHPR